MGCGKSKASEQLTKSQLYIGTLNYCSIMNSPFQFYCQDLNDQLQEISDIFSSLIPQYVPNFNKDSFKWGMGKIDVKLRTERYSPLFSVHVGIQNNHFITQERFNQIWNARFEQQIANIDLKYSEQQKRTAQLYDFISLHALLSFVYKRKNFDQLINKDPQLYIKTLSPFFELTFLDQKRKLDKIIQNFKNMNIDIFFLQQYSQYFQKYISEGDEFIWSVDSTKDTMIIAKKTSFNSINDTETILTKQQIQSLNWAGRTSILCLDNLILICAHLTSKAQKNKPQIESLKKSLIKLKKELPQYDIILGGDLNSFLAPNQQFNQFFQMFPAEESCLTTVKRRTMTQAQFNKGNKIVQQSKDKIVTTLKMKDCKVLYIDNTQPKKQQIIPKNDHPFDHFVVVATVYK